MIVLTDQSGMRIMPRVHKTSLSKFKNDMTSRFTDQLTEMLTKKQTFHRGTEALGATSGFAWPFSFGFGFYFYFYFSRSRGVGIS